MDFENINWEQVTNRAVGATAAIFIVSAAERELPKMNKTTKDAQGKEIVEKSPFFEYRHYGYALVGAVLPEVFKPTKNKDDFATKYAGGIQAFSDAMLFYGATGLLENALPQYVQIGGVGESFANYVLGADASTSYAMQNYVAGADEQVMLIERETGARVFIDANGNPVKQVPYQLEKPMPMDSVMSDVMPEDVQVKYCMY
jgi:hypothetical protein